MPIFEPATLPEAQLNPIVNFLLNPPRNQTPLPLPSDGVTRYTGPPGSLFRTSDMHSGHRSAMERNRSLRP
jgi:hypothetical protein